MLINIKRSNTAKDEVTHLVSLIYLAKLSHNFPQDSTKDCN